MRRSALILLSAMMLAIVLFAGAANADVIYSNFNSGSGDLFDTSNANCAMVAPTQSIGMKFTVSGGDYYLSTIDLPLYYDLRGDPSHEITISIASNSQRSLGSDISYEVPGTILESMSLNEGAISGTHLVTVNSSSNPLLKNGNTYWVVATGVAATGGQAYWNYNNIGAKGQAYTGYTWTNEDSWNWYYNQPACAFRVSGVAAAVPEPSSLMALFAGIGTMGGVFFRRRR
ncbi:MAG: PEP-CTERM sorting domain-containing protein [Armatimonadota bacterium]